MQEKAKHNLKLVMAESIIAYGVLCMPIMTLFYYSIGMNNAEIALTQSIFSLVMVLLDLPTGWIADKFGRKWSNIIGDLGQAGCFLYYCTAKSFTEVVIVECLLAVFNSLSAGVDYSLLRHFSNKLEPGEKLFRSKATQLVFWQNVGTLITTIIGGAIGAISYRGAIAISAVAYLVGGTVSMFIDDDSEKLVQKHRNPLKDIGRVAVESFQNKSLRLHILAQTFGREMTHVAIWLLTPILLAAKVPAWLVAIGYVLNYTSAIIGTKLAKRYAGQLADWQVLMIPVLLVAIGTSVLSVKISLISLPFYLLMGITQGWTASTLKPLTMQHAKASEQTSVASLASTMGRLLYVPTSWIVGMMADTDLRLAMATIFIMFVPIGVMLVKQLKRMNN